MKQIKLISIIAILLIIYILINVFIPLKVNAITVVQTRKVVTNVNEIETTIDETKYPGYKNLLISLKEKHPTWNFTLLETGLNWETVIYNETEANHARSLVQGLYGEWLCPTCVDANGNYIAHDGSDWYGASKKAVEYIMDPRNWIKSDYYMFQFETLSFIESVHTEAGVEAILKGTFMANKRICDQYGEGHSTNTFAQAILAAAKDANVSPYHIASRIRQEIGATPSLSVTGTYSGYEGYYNFYNIGASGGSGAIGRGLSYAKGEGLSQDVITAYGIPWNTPEKAIIGGAKWIAKKYISIGQDTLYFQKFDVIGTDTSNMFYYQYMQNLTAAKSEGYTMYSSYAELGLLENNYNFVIPLYLNMPEVTYEPKSNNYSTEAVKVITNDGGSVNFRDAAGGNIIGQVITGERLFRIDPKNIEANGIKWSKVIKENGTVGFIANQYLQTITIDTTNKELVTVTTQNDPSVRMRTGPTTNSNMIQWVDTGTELYRIEKGSYADTGYYWDIIMLKDGTIGFMATNYLKIVQTTQPEKPQPGDNEEAELELKIDEENKRIKTTPEVNLKKIKEKNDGKTITAVDKDGKSLSDTDNLGTGAIVTINEVQYTVIKMGDVNGDAEIDVIDLALLKRHLMGTQTLNTCYLQAGIIQEDTTEIDIIDLALLKRYLIGNTTFTIK